MWLCFWVVRHVLSIDHILEAAEKPCGKLTVCYWKWPFIVELPIKKCDFPYHSYVSVPEGMYIIETLLFYSRIFSGFTPDEHDRVLDLP